MEYPVNQAFSFNKTKKSLIGLIKLQFFHNVTVSLSPVVSKIPLNLGKNPPCISSENLRLQYHLKKLIPEIAFVRQSDTLTKDLWPLFKI